MRLPLIIGIALIVLTIALDAYIYVRIKRSRRAYTKLWSRVYLWSTAITLLLTAAVVIWPKRDSELSLLPVMWMLFTWISIYVPKLIFTLASFADYIPRLWHGRPVSAGLYVGLPIGLIVFASMWYGAIWGRRIIDVKEVSIASPRLPAGFKGFKIVQFSDAHVGTWGNDTAFVSNLVDEINSLHPDIIVFTGDIVNRKTEEIKPFISILGRLKAPKGVFSVMGNHDYGNYANWPSEKEHEANTSELRRIQKSMGWHLLENESVVIHEKGDSIQLAGVENWGEPPFNAVGDIKRATTGINPGIFTILLSHNPMHWHLQVRDSYDIDLTLSGHTHAMQMRLQTPWKDYSLSALKYPEWEGLWEHRRSDNFKSLLYVNIGCGEVGFPARIGANPEITLITLE